MRVASGLGIWLLLGVLWLASLPLRPLFDPDEGRYAEIPREMVAGSDWVTPRLNDLKYFEKPPLQYWATAAFYTVFGVHDWAARLWATLLAFLCVPMVYLFALRVGYPKDTALVAAGLLATNPYYLIMGQLNLLDQGLAFFLCLAVFAFVLAQREPVASRSERNWMLLTWTSLALAVLSKGIVAPALTGATLVVYMLTCRDASPLRRMHFLPGLPLFLLITVPWFWLVQSRNPEFAQYFFVHEHFQRFVNNGKEHIEAWWYFIFIVLFALLPVIWNARRWRASEPVVPGAFRVERFLFIWCAVVLVFFSASSSKLASYVIPLMPVAALLLARVTAAQASAVNRARITLLVIMILAAVGIVASGHRSGPLPAEAFVWGAAVLAVCLAAVYPSSAATEPGPRWMALAAACVAGFQCLSMCYAAVYPGRSAKLIVSELQGQITPDTHLYGVAQFRQTLGWYLQRSIDLYDYDGELAFGAQHAEGGPRPRDRGQFLQRWRQETRALAFIDKDIYEELRAAGMPGHIVARDARSIAVSR